MKVILKNAHSVLQKGNQHFKRKKSYAQQSMDFFAKNMVKDLPFMSRYVTTKYNKYLLTKHRDKFLRIKNFLNFKITEKDDLSNAFDKLNFIRLKIMLIERDITAYRNALKLGFDSKDSNMVLQKKIRHKYAKLRKFDTYQNLSLGVIYDKSILGDKIAAYTDAANNNREKITEKYDSMPMLNSMQREFIFNIIATRQPEDKIFEDNVSIEVFRRLLTKNPEYQKSLSNIDTFTNYYLAAHPGSLSKEFVQFKALHAKSNINTIVKAYLDMYAKKYVGTSAETLNAIQQELFASFTYNDFKSSEIFAAMDRALSLNDILLKAKINFAKMEMCNELEYCLDLPEINNYFKIIEAKDRIKNYIVSNERLFVERIEKEFPEIKSTEFIYMYNKVRSTLQQYRLDIIETEQYFVRDYINAVMDNEFDDADDEDNINATLDDISLGIYKNPTAINAKHAFDTYIKLITQFNYIKTAKNAEFEEMLEDSKLFHGVLVTKKLKPILPLDIQSKIISLPYEAQVNLAKNYRNTTTLDMLDQFDITPIGDLKLGDDVLQFGTMSSASVSRLSMIMASAKLEDYITIAKDVKGLKNEINLAEYMIGGIEEDLHNSIASTIIPRQQPTIPDSDEDNDDENETIEEADSIEASNEDDNTQIDEVVNYKKAKKYIDIIAKEKNEKERTRMLLALQKRINATSIRLQDVQIDNLNETLNPMNLALRTPANYVVHLIEKYKSDKRDINSLQVGLKLRIRTGNLVLTDEEINTINDDYNLSLIQRVKPRVARSIAILAQSYKCTGTLSDTAKEKLAHTDALVRNTLKKKSTKLVPLDMILFNILNE